MSAREVIDGTKRWSIELGEAVRSLLSLPDGCVDAVVCDSPYASGGQFRGDRAQSTSSKYTITGTIKEYPEFFGDTRDQRSHEKWCFLWLSEALRATREGGVLLTFCDWRQLAVYLDAVQIAGWVLRGVIPWAKPSARPTMGRFTGSCEFIVWASKGGMAANVNVGCLPGFYQINVEQNKNHPSGKPVELMEQLLKIVPSDSLILDMFTGGGSTAAAAIRRGQRFIGCELSPEYHAISCQRCEAEAQGSDVVSYRAGQLPLLGAK